MKLFNPVFHWKYLESHDFRITSEDIQGTNCYLINPSGYKPNWISQDLIFRSSIWDNQGMPVSLSFKKFFNWGEATNLIPPPDSIKNLTIMEKLDGSTLIVSKYKGQMIFRTRGSFDVSGLDNRDEIELFIKTYPQVLSLEESDTWMHSYVFEWYSPRNKIVINYGNEPKWWLTNVIDHEDYTYWPQKELDVWAEHKGFDRPRTFKVNSLEDLMTFKPVLDEMFEGFCVYFNDDQDILKIKTTKYLAIHAFKSELSLEKMVDLYIIYGKPEYTEFLRLIESNFDYECMSYAMPMISKICDARKEVDKIIHHMKFFVENLIGLSRKDAAEDIKASYGATNKTAIAFNLLDGKEVTNKQFKILIAQFLR